MSEYTDLGCDSPQTAEAVRQYLNQQLAEMEEIERPNIEARVEKSTIRIKYMGLERLRCREWDMQLMGYRDGLGVASDAGVAGVEDVSIEETVRRLRERFPRHYLSTSREGRTILGMGYTLERIECIAKIRVVSASYDNASLPLDFEAPTLAEALAAAMSEEEEDS